MPFGKIFFSGSTTSLPSPEPALRFRHRPCTWGATAAWTRTKATHAMQQVVSWRRTGNLPFPGPTEENIEHLADTLDYPPRGSPGAGRPKSEAHDAVEPLSADSDSEDVENEEDAANPERR